MDALIEDFESEQLKQEIPEFHIGDTIRVSTKIIEGEKERIQVFQGTVIARKGRGLSETFSLHRVSYGEGMERVFFLHSPRIVKIQVVKQGDARRAKLYDLRGKTGKAAKIKEKIGVRKSRSKAVEMNQERIIETEMTESEESAEYEAAKPEPAQSISKE
jgi:large subunit ribosomal protein L19